MKQADFDDCIIMACKAANLRRVSVFGSQSVLAQLHYSDLPELATGSREADISTEARAEQVADQVHGDGLNRVC